MMRQFVRFAGLIGILGLAGCGGPSGSTGAVVSGAVTVGGKGPLTGGSITFIPVATPDKTRSATINPDGTYQVPDVPTGECKVTVDNLYLKSLPPAPSTGVDSGAAPKYMKIDPKFAKADTSGLSTTVSRKTHTYNVDVK